MIILPIHPMSVPNNVLPEMNGNMPDDLLAQVDDIQLHIYAAPSWVEFQQYILNTFNWNLGATEGYRDYAKQRLLFLSRYTTSRAEAAVNYRGDPLEVRSYQGRTFYLRPGQFSAAIPGTSNHGLGLAVDACELVLGRKLKLGEVQVENLVSGADRFGWGWEIQTEEWHLRYTVGWPWSTQTQPPPPVITEPEESEVAASHIIQNSNPYWAKFIRFDNGQIVHVGPSEYAKYSDLPIFTEDDPAAYLRLCVQSGTEWRPT